MPKIAQGHQKCCSLGILVSPVKPASSAHCQSLTSNCLRQVIRRANNTEYGLAAGVFTQNLAMANTISRALKAGTVWVNTWNQFDAGVPFGGYKTSGIGREKGEAALSHYTQVTHPHISMTHPHVTGLCSSRVSVHWLSIFPFSLVKPLVSQETVQRSGQFESRVEFCFKSIHQLAGKNLTVCCNAALP